MNSKIWIPALGVVVVIAIVMGLRGTAPVVAEPTAPPTAAAPQEGALPPGHPPIGSAMPGLPAGHPELPPGMPGAAGGGAAGQAADGEGALEWTTPPRWQGAPNPSSMRIATFRIPKTGGDTEDAEMSVSRAGGSVAANADRWVGQFDPASQKNSKRTERTLAQVGGGRLKATLVEVEGTFASGSMMGGPSTPKTGYALIGAIVENPASPGSAYFFKLTGPAATVKAARSEVDALLGSLKGKK